MQIYFNGKVSHYKDAFPNTSFPASGPSDAFLSERGAVKVSLFREHDRATQKLVACSPVVENGFAYVVKVENKTQEELDADAAGKAAQVRAVRDRRLAETDWMVIKHLELNENIPGVWEVYRQALRDVPAQAGFPWDVTFPNQPE